MFKPHIFLVSAKKFNSMICYSLSVIKENKFPLELCLQKRHFWKGGLNSFFQSVQNARNSKPSNRFVLNFDEYDKAEIKDKKTFLELIKLYELNFENRKGLVDFIRISLSKMRDFGVHKDLEVYKKLLDLMPKGPYIPKNKFMADYLYFPEQQFVAVELMDMMAFNSVCIDKEFEEILFSIFGRVQGHATKHMGNQIYWTIKWQNSSPWPLPKTIPQDSQMVAKLAIERITSVDPKCEVSTHQTETVPDSLDKTWIVSGQSSEQRQLLQNHPVDTPVIVEGGDLVWINDMAIKYFILKADSQPHPYEFPEDPNDLSKIESMYLNPRYKKPKPPRSVHEQDDATIYAVCATGTSSRDSLLSWVRILEQNGNTVLQNVPVLFRMKNPEKVPAIFTEELISQAGN